MIYRIRSKADEFLAPANFLKKVTLKKGEELLGIPHQEAVLQFADDELETDDAKDKDYIP
ncbi:hypothetical protein AKO1_002093 [Acrasis kona]|uniref:Uncharacterized protein n=1 Tax=Acrasis kona TaxID=1008807 RepID=A0AAW2YN74_9EUKA